jgi:hypothetical protein
VSLANQGAMMLRTPDRARGWDGNPVESRKGKYVYFREGGRMVGANLRAAVYETWGVLVSLGKVDKNLSYVHLVR